MENFFIDENKHGKPIEMYSPSGKYRIVIQTYNTKKGYWQYSSGSIYIGNTLIQCIQRDYVHFPFLFIENHHDGHDYLICGEHYEDQTIVQLDTGIKKNYEGNEFCWGSFSYNREHKIIIVDGCYWACPYEYKLFDFSNPMESLDEIEVQRDGLDDLEDPTSSDSGNAKPEINGNIISFFDTISYSLIEELGLNINDFEIIGDPPKDPENDEDNRYAVIAFYTYLLSDKKLILQSRWLSDYKIKWIENYKNNSIKFNEWNTLFKNTDPLYLKYKELTNVVGYSLGQTYNGWCDGFNTIERRFHSRIAQRSDDNPYTVDLEWGIVTGPIMLTIYKDGDFYDKKVWMKHSVESIVAAFEYYNKVANAK